MPRKKVRATAATADLPALTEVATTDETEGSAETERVIAALRARSFKPTLTVAEKGVTIGVRDGHDWVMSFPGDPGKPVKDRLSAAGFTYRDRKWKVFTNAANRPEVESLVKDLRRELGEEIRVNEYAARQVVLAFDSPPGEEFTAQLREADFHFRNDRTWNAAYTAVNQRFAYDFVKSLPNVERSAGR